MATGLFTQSSGCPDLTEVLQITKEYCSSHDRAMNFSSFSPSLYDTAWLSLVPTEHEPQGRLFPQCLDILLQAQQADGAWPCYASQTDGIIVSLVALLSVSTHRARAPSSSKEYQTLTQQIERGTAGLNRLLRSWDVDNAVHVGFEILVTALLRQLEDKMATEFDFPGRSKLMRLHQKKMSKFSPKILYGPKQTTLLHSAEAFIDVINFQDISHHCTEDFGIFGSPAATAAYLIYSTQWDHRAETYLRRVMTAYGGTGEVPNAFPTPMFELSWTISTVLSPVIEERSLKDFDLQSVTSFFAKTLSDQKGLMGFAPGILEDADDTARNLLTLVRLRRVGYTVAVDLAPMINKFETEECFKTYELERNSSFSANCNVVMVMLELEREVIDQYATQIEKALRFLLDLAQFGNGKITDKWNISSEYSFMLLVEVFVLALKRHDEGCLQAISQDFFTCRIPMNLCRILSQILAAQENDGSWMHSLEVTSYSILALSHTLRLPWCQSICGHLTGRVEQAQSFLRTQYPTASVEQKDYLWVEKTTFQSSLLRMAYCSMALHTTTTAEEWSSSIIGTFTHADTSGQSDKMKKLFLMLPLLRNVSPAMLDLALIETKFHARNLADNRNSVLPRSELPLSQDKYLGYIPLIWLLSNQVNRQALSAGIMDDMLKLSQLTFQVDEFMETTVASLSHAETNFLKSWIRSECEGTSLTSTDRRRPSDSGYGSGCDEHCQHSDDDDSCSVQSQKSFVGSDAFCSAQNGLQNFIRYILGHGAVLQSSPLVQHFLAMDLADYLLAHMQQNHDNRILQKSKEEDCDTKLVSRGSYFAWVRGTGADHTSCPFSFRFFLCLISRTTNGLFDNAQAQYYSTSVARHLATMCRQYNDFGSIARDAAESNLNSVDFAELLSEGGKENLMAIAEFERQLMQCSLNALEKTVQSAETTAAVKVLVDVTDLFGQLYVAKDIASQKTKIVKITKTVEVVLET